MWVNQPSTLQPFHHLHGKKVLAAKTAKLDQAIVFIVHDDFSTSEPLAMPALCLSHGWPNGEPAVNYDPIAAANPRRAHHQPQRMTLQSNQTETSAAQHVIAVQELDGSLTVYPLNGPVISRQTFPTETLQAATP